MMSEIGQCKVKLEVPSEIEKRGYNPVQKSVFSISKLEGVGWKISGSMKEKMAKAVNFLKENNK